MDQERISVLSDGMTQITDTVCHQGKVCCFS